MNNFSCSNLNDTECLNTPSCVNQVDTACPSIDCVDSCKVHFIETCGNSTFCNIANPACIVHNIVSCNVFPGCAINNLTSLPFGCLKNEMASCNLGSNICNNIPQCMNNFSCSGLNNTQCLTIPSCVNQVDTACPSIDCVDSCKANIIETCGNNTFCNISNPICMVHNTVLCTDFVGCATNNISSLPFGCVIPEVLSCNLGAGLCNENLSSCFTNINCGDYLNTTQCLTDPLCVIQQEMSCPSTNCVASCNSDFLIPCGSSSIDCDNTDSRCMVNNTVRCGDLTNCLDISECQIPASISCNSCGSCINIPECQTTYTVNCKDCPNWALIPECVNQKTTIEFVGFIISSISSFIHLTLICIKKINV